MSTSDNGLAVTLRDLGQGSLVELVRGYVHAGQRGTAGLRVVLIAVLVLGIAGAAAGVAAFFLLKDDARAPEQTAKLLPARTNVYVSVNLRPGRGQLKNLRDIVERFRQHPDFQRRVDEQLDDAEDRTRIDLRDDILPWLGPEVAVGLIDVVGSAFASATSGVPLLVALLGTTDEESSLAFLRDWTNYLEERLGLDFDTGEYRGLTVYSEGDDFQHFAVAEGFLVFSTDKDLLEDTIDRILDGDSTGSLYESRRFLEARDALPVSRFASVYVDTEAIWLDARREFGGELPADLRRQINDAVPEWTALAGTFVTRGVKLITLAAASEEVNGQSSPENSLASARLVPPDTMAFASFALDPDLDPVREQLKDQSIEEFDPEVYDALVRVSSDLGLDLEPSSSLDEVLDASLDLFEETIGLDLEQDFLRWMTGEFAFALLPTNLSAVVDDPESAAVELAAFIQIHSSQRDRVVEIMNKVIELVEDAVGSPAERVSYGGGEGAVFDLGELDTPAAYQPGYLILDDQLVLATNRAGLQGVATQASDPNSSLAQEPVFARVVKEFQGTLNPLFYVNLQEIREQVVSTLNTEDLQQYRDQFEPFVQPFRILAMASDGQDGVSRFSILVTIE